jgi:hypothetical protein
MSLYEKSVPINQTEVNKNNNKNIIDDEEDQAQEQVFEACLFNCTYVEQQLEDEEKGSNIRIQHNTRQQEEGEKLDVVVSDSISEEGTMSMDDKSLLDYDSSNSWESEK